MCMQGQAAAPLSPASLANIPTDSLSSAVMPQNTSFQSGVTHHHLTFQLLATYQITFFVMHSGFWVHEFLLNIDSSGPILNISVLCQRVKMSFLPKAQKNTHAQHGHIRCCSLFMTPPLLQGILQFTVQRTLCTNSSCVVLHRKAERDSCLPCGRCSR